MSFSLDPKSQIGIDMCLKYKIVVLGESSVGKTSIINKFINGKFNEDCQPTIGIDFISKSFNVEDQIIKFQLWDTAGQERFRSLIPCYIRDCQVAIIVYDVQSKNIQCKDEVSQKEVKNWIYEVISVRKHEAQIFIVGNKIDLKGSRYFSLQNRKISQEFMKNLGYSVTEVSAKTGEGIIQLFQQITTQLQISESIDFHLQQRNNELKQQSIKIQNKKQEDKNCCFL